MLLANNTATPGDTDVQIIDSDPNNLGTGCSMQSTSTSLLIIDYAD